MPCLFLVARASATIKSTELFQNTQDSGPEGIRNWSFSVHGVTSHPEIPAVSGAYLSAAALFLWSDRGDDVISYVTSPVQHTVVLHRTDLGRSILGPILLLSKQPHKSRMLLLGPLINKE